MFKILLERLRQKHRTSAYPKKDVVLPNTYRGKPKLAPHLCTEGCTHCQEVCPTDAFVKDKAGQMAIDLSRCLFCLECQKACPKEAIAFTQDYRLATRHKNDLITNDNELVLAEEFEHKILKLFGRSLKLRQVSAAGCNACEADTNVLGTLFFDLSRFGIQFVASPRHADGLLVTGPVSENMREALLKTYEALPEPKIVIAVGACALSGGVFRTHDETHQGADKLIPVDLYIPGCPPHPMTILDGLLRVLGKIR